MPRTARGTAPRPFEWIAIRARRARAWDWLAPLRSRDIAIDLGTANTLLATDGLPEIRSEPSVVAVQADGRGGEVVRAVGHAAKRMLGRTPGTVRAVCPLRDGVIADFELAEFLIRHFIESSQQGWRLFRPRLVVAVPSGITAVEKRAIRDAAVSAGAREVHIMHEPMAGAIGSGLPVTEPRASMVVDIGGGTTDIAVIALGGIVCGQSLRVGGDAMDIAIRNYVKKELGLIIGESSAERIKLQVGSASLEPSGGKPRTLTIKGNDPVGRLPKSVEVSSDDIATAVGETIAAIVAATRATLERTPPELASDLAEHGLLLTGGGALLPGLDAVLSAETGLQVLIADDPLRAVVIGCKACLRDVDLLRMVEIT